MRHILLALLFFCIPGWAVSVSLDSVPNPRLVSGSHVSDPDRIVGTEATAEIDRLLVTLERDTGAQVAVVALDSIGQQNTFDFAQALFERWGIGDKTRDNGLLMLLVKDQRMVRMHTGYGLEGALPDVVCKRIQSEAMLPAFKDGHYGAGLVAGVRAVTGILADPAQAQAADTLSAAAWEDKKKWWGFKFIASILGTLAAIIAYSVKANGGDFSTSGAGQPGTPMKMRWTARQWLLAFVGGPTLIVVGFDQVGAGSRIVACVIAIYIYFMLVAGYQAWRQQRTITDWAERNSFRLCYDLIGRRQRFWLWMALFFPVPFLFHYFFQLNRKTHYRNAPRSCPTCTAPMRRLSEEDEDAYLSKAQQMEETLHSADHDIWRCTACEATTSTAYPGTDSTYEKCPHCNCLAYFKESSHILLKPTEASRGKGESTHACKFCGHREVTAYAIAMLVASNSSSGGGSSSGGSSSGSSWGGGSSGGGGASSSW